MGHHDRLGGGHALPADPGNHACRQLVDPGVEARRLRQRHTVPVLPAAVHHGGMDRRVRGPEGDAERVTGEDQLGVGTEQALEDSQGISDAAQYRVGLHGADEHVLGRGDGGRPAELGHAGHPREGVEVDDGEMPHRRRQHMAHVELEPTMTGQADDRTPVLQMRSQRGQVGRVEEGGDGQNHHVATPGRLLRVARHPERLRGGRRPRAIPFLHLCRQAVALEDPTPFPRFGRVQGEDRHLHAGLRGKNAGEDVGACARTAEDDSQAMSADGGTRHAGAPFPTTQSSSSRNWANFQ